MVVRQAAEAERAAEPGRLGPHRSSQAAVPSQKTYFLWQYAKNAPDATSPSRINGYPLATRHISRLCSQGASPGPTSIRMPRSRPDCRGKENYQGACLFQ